MVGQPQGRGDATTAWCGQTPRSSAPQLRRDFPSFAAVVLAAHVSDTHNALTEWGAALFLGSRRVRAPLGRRGSADPFAHLEHRDDRPHADHRRSGFGVMATAL